MSFLDDKPDLNGTIFSMEQLNSAREYLKSAIERHDPAWLTKPSGFLGINWRANGQDPACQFINIAYLLSTLERNITQKSLSILIEKFKKILRLRDEELLKATLTEFEVATFLLERVSPISIDPLVPEELLFSNNRPPSPDFAIRLSGGNVFIEVTTIYFGMINEWNKVIRYIMDHLISRHLLKDDLRKQIDLLFPLLVSINDIRKLVREIIDKIAKSPTGTLSIAIKDKQAIIRWINLPHIETSAGGRPQIPKGVRLRYATFNGPQGLGMIMPPGATDYMTFAVKGNSAVAIEAFLLAEDARELILKSLRGSLDNKRRQFPHEAPYLLVIKLGHHQLISDAFHKLIEERIWPNRDYAWITGICIFNPRTGFKKGVPAPSMYLFLNPNSRVRGPALKDLTDLFEGKKTFHS